MTKSGGDGYVDYDRAGWMTRTLVTAEWKFVTRTASSAGILDDLQGFPSCGIFPPYLILRNKQNAELFLHGLLSFEGVWFSFLFVT